MIVLWRAQQVYSGKANPSANQSGLIVIKGSVSVVGWSPVVAELFREVVSKGGEGSEEEEEKGPGIPNKEIPVGPCLHCCKFSL